MTTLKQVFAEGLATIGRRLQGFRSAGTIEVGVINDATNASKLVFSEMGTNSAPARPSLSAAFDATQGDIEQLVDDGVQKVVLEGADSADALAPAGELLVARTRQTIDQRVDPPLAPATVRSRAQRGNTSTLPLKDTGAMYDALTFRVTGGGRDG